MSISMQKFLSTPVHPGAYHAALAAYRAAGTPDDSGLSSDEKIKAMLAVCNAVHAMIKGPMDMAAAEAGRLWDSALTGQQKRLIGASPAMAPVIVADAIKQDHTLAQKIATQSAPPGSETSIHAGFYDARGNSPFDRLGAGSARPDIRVRRQPVEAARLEVSSKALCNATGVGPATEPIARH
jgi:hypothetical protein